MEAAATNSTERDLITQAEFARRRGCNRSHISRMVKAGRIVLHGGLIDFDEASTALDANTNPAMVKSHPPADAPEPKRSRRVPDTTDNLVSFEEARTRKEYADALLKELRLAKERGELVDVSEVRREQYAHARKERAAIEAIPERVASQLAAALGIDVDPAIVRSVMVDELRNVIEELSDDARLG